MIFDNGIENKEHTYPLNWGAEYTDGTFDKEFDENGTHTDFYSIKNEKIKRFGLYNSQVKLFYQNDGSFYLNGQLIEIEYHVKDKIYHLTSNFENKDCITFKEAGMTPRGNGKQKSELQAICFGYKTLLTMNDDTQFYFKPIVVAPFIGEDRRLFIETTITSNKNLKGKLVFKNKSKIVEVFDFPLKKNYNSVMNWTIK